MAVTIDWIIVTILTVGWFAYLIWAGIKDNKNRNI